jgi:hypothetical protein
VTDDVAVAVGFFRDVPDDVTAAAMRRGDPQQSTTPFAQPWPHDRWPDVPTRVPASRDDRPFPPEFQRRVVRDRFRLPRRRSRRPPGGAELADRAPAELSIAAMNPVPS